MISGHPSKKFHEKEKRETSTTSALTPGYFDLPAGSSAGRGAALAAGAVAAVRAVFDLRRS